MPKFWQRAPCSVENLCTFVVQVCADCARFADPDLREEARPICILNSYLAALATKRADEGAPFDSDLPEWMPTVCARHMDL